MSRARPPLSVERVPIERAELLGSLLHECLTELGASTDYPYIPLYWEEAGREPYLFFVEGTVAGFALVREVERSVQEMAEFWVVPGHRHMGIGRAAALELFRAHPGEWVVSSYPGNVAAETFWRNVISEAGLCVSVASRPGYRFTTDNMSVHRAASGGR